jgi:2-keto-4-pentenoate hydratase
MTLSPQEQSLFNLIHDARGHVKPVSGKDTERGVDLDGAYRVARAFQGQRILKGYKLGLVSPAKQQQMGIDSPIYGPIYADTIYQKKVSLSDFVQPRFEPEIATVLRDSIGTNASAAEISAAIGGYFLGVDILDSIWEGYKFTLTEVVADSTSCGGFLPGQVMYEHMPTGSLYLFIDGKLQTEGPISGLGDPIEHLGWLAATVGGLDAGMLIFFGSPAAAIPAQAGTLEVVSSEGHSLVAKITE